MCVVQRECGRASGGLSHVKQCAAVGHGGGYELLQNVQRLGAKRGQPQPLMNHRNASQRRHLAPDFPGPLGTPPGIASALSRHGDEAEVPDRSAHTGRVAFDDTHPQTAASSRVGMGQANDAGAHHNEVKSLQVLHR